MLLQRFGEPANLNGPNYALVHDAYHTLPGQFCEGKPGSGHSFRFSEREASRDRTTVYVIGLGDREHVRDWNMTSDGQVYAAAREGRSWSLSLDGTGGMTVTAPSNKMYIIK